MLTARQKSDIEIITRMYRQQKSHFENNNPRESVKDRIVSISKPYVRPIVRGKDEVDRNPQLVRREVNEIAQAA